MVKKLKTKTGMITFILIMSTVVVSLSYGSFVITSGKFKASELLISNLNYSITIEDSNGNIISGNSVTVDKGTKEFFNIIVSSVNKIDSKYNLAFKQSGNAVVKYTDRTNWISEGEIKGYDTKTYSKKIRVVVDNSKENTETKVEFKVYGGYSYNTYAQISLKDGYVLVGGPYEEIIAVTGNRIVDIIESETGCTTSIKGNCLFGGGSISNYIKFEGKEEIYRIIGTYKIDDKVTTKIIGNIRENISKDKIETSLNSIYDELDNKEVVENTNLFNCTESGCNISNFNKIGLLSLYEYNLIGGNNSYLGENSYYLIDNGEVKESEEESLRGVMYLKTNTRVTGKGTISDPYVINNGSDINLMAYTIKGVPTERTYSDLMSKNLVNKVTCEKGTKAEWSYTDYSIHLTNIQAPDSCTIDFKEGYVVTTNVVNGRVDGSNSVGVGYNETTTFKLIPNTDYQLKGSTLSCTGTYSSASLNETTGEVKITGIKSGVTCSVNMYPERTLYTALTSYPTVKTATDRGSFDSAFGSSTATSGVIYKESTYKESGLDVYYFAGNVSDNWVSFGGYYWRIIRTNEDGSVRLLYAGDSPSTTTGYIKQSQKYNSSYSAAQYVGYDISEIKTTVDNWYRDNLNTNYDKYVSKTAIYCNDRGTDQTSGTIYYGARDRLYNNGNSGRRATYKCGQKIDGSMYSNADVRDRFSKTTSSGGNGLLTYPIGLMTADEVAFAGGIYGNSSSNTYYYLNANNSSITGTSYWWTMSPYYFNGSLAYVFYVYGSGSPGYLYRNDVGNTYAVRPVVSLKSCTQVSGGNGTSGSPYTVSVSDTCAVSEN